MLSDLELAVREVIWDALLVPGYLYILTYSWSDDSTFLSRRVRFVERNADQWCFDHIALPADCSAAWKLTDS